MKRHFLLRILVGVVIYSISLACVGGNAPDNRLKIVIIRHGEKPETGDNLSCQGESRALFDDPQTAYTRELVEAVPHLERGQAASAGLA